MTDTIPRKLVYLLKQRTFFSKTFFTASALLFCFNLFTPANAQDVNHVRRNIRSYTSAERTQLANLMMEYITPQIIEFHCNMIENGNTTNIHSSNNFLSFHRAYLEGMEDFLLKKGYPQFVPIPYWNPGEAATPQEFRVVDTQDCQAANCSVSCGMPPHWNPGISLPSALTLPIRPDQNNDLCDFIPPPISYTLISPTCISDVIEGEQGNIANSSYHNSVHGAMGGAMGAFKSPAAPIFWCFHAYVDDIWRTYQCSCPNRGKDHDLYMKDNPHLVMDSRDVGEEPSTDPDPITLSKDIWVRNQNDGQSNGDNQNPIYSKQNYVYIHVRNRGCQPSDGTDKLVLYWSKGSTDQSWPSYWNGTVNSPALMGNIIDTITIPVIPSASSVVLELPWFPPNSANYSSNANPTLFSLLARIVSASDPMTTAEGTNAQTNARNNNNIIMKNVTVDTPANISPSITLTAPANNAQYNAPATVSITATASDQDGSISKVAFYNGNTKISTSNNSPYQFTWSGVATGTYTITARAFDNLNDSTVSNPVTIVVKDNQAPVVSIQSPTDGANFIAPATFTIIANAQDNDGTISKVEFYEGNSLLGSATTAPYTYTVTSLAAGTYTYTAQAYDNLNAKGISATVKVIVRNNKIPAIAISQPLNNTVFTEPADVDIKINATDTDGTISKVELYNGNTLLATLTTPPYNYPWTGVTQGSYILKAIAYDNLGATNTSVKDTIIVNKKDVLVQIISPSNGSVFIAPANISIEAKVNDNAITVQKIEFYNGGTLIGTANSSPYQIPWNNVLTGTYSVTAKAYDANGIVGISDVISITMNENKAPLVQIISPANDTTAITPSDFTIKANASDDGNISKVEFYANTTIIGTSTVTPYSTEWKNVPSGTYTVTAKAYDDQGITQVSAGIKITVNNNQSPTVKITSPVDGYSIIGPATVTININANDADGSIAKVDVYENATLLTTLTSLPYTYTWNAVSPGSYTLTAKATDDRNANTISDNVAIVVKANKAPVVNITAPKTDTTILSPAVAKIKAQASDSDGSIKKVDFYEGSTLLGSDISSPYSFDWNKTPAGSYTITAKAYDNMDLLTASDKIIIHVVDNLLPLVKISKPTKDTSYIISNPIQLSAQASDADGSISKVEFYSGTTLLGTSTTTPYNYTWNNAALGDYKIIAKAYDNRNAASTSDTIKINVHENKMPMAMINHPMNTAIFKESENIEIGAEVHDEDGTVVKTEFYQNDTLLGSSTTSPFVYNWTNAKVGKHTLTIMAYDNLGAMGMSEAVYIEVVKRVVPIVQISSPASGDVFMAGAQTTINAIASRTSESKILRIGFYVDSILIGNDSIEPYSTSWNNLTAGTHLLQIKGYDDAGDVIISNTVLVNVNGAIPTVAITSPATGNQFAAGSTISLSADAHDDMAIQRVEFYSGSTLLGSDTTLPYTFSWKNVAIGSYSITAKAYDNLLTKSASAPVEIKVATNQLPMVSITSPKNGANYIANASITIDATANDNDGTIQHIEFYSGNTFLGSDSTQPYTFTWQNVAIGSYTITARAYDNSQAKSISAAVGIKVATNQLPIISILSPKSGDSYSSPATIIIEANSYDNDGSISKVAFYNGSTLLGTDTTSPYSYTWQNVIAGDYVINARAYDNLNAISISPSIGIKVNDVSTGINDGVVDLTKIIVHPVPFDEQFTVQLALDKPQNINIKLYDEAGKVVYTMLNVLISPDQVVKVTPPLISDGMYYLVVQSKNQIIRKKIAKISSQ